MKVEQMLIDTEKSKISGWKIDKKLLSEALTHPSYFQIEPSKKNYERLEFLGDSVLDLLLAEWLYQFVNEKVGLLSKIRSLLVQAETLSNLGYEIGLDMVMLKDNYYIITPTDLEDGVEAIFGAVYLSRGLEKARILFSKIFKERLETLLLDLSNEEGKQKIANLTVCERNPINRLQEICQQQKSPLPEYKLKEKKGTDHDPLYFVECRISTKDSDFSSIGTGRNLKTARRMAANLVLEQFETVEKEDL